MTIRAEHFQELLKSPRLSLYAREIQAVLEEESRSRQGFYEQITEGDKAEFINGKIIIHSPAMLRHNATAKRLLVLLDAYVQEHNLGYVGFEKIMISLTRNDYEPDICYFEQRKAVQFVPEQYLFNPTSP